MLDPTIAPAVSAALTRICQRGAFFGALALFARFQSSATVPTAATDGRDVYLNTNFFGALAPPEQEALLLHEVLHAALLHVPRRAGRDARLWNIAADIVVNGMLAQAGYQLPAGGLRDPARERLGVEEIYELLLKRKPPAGEPMPDLLSGPPDDAGAGAPAQPADKVAANSEGYWEQALRQAQVVAESTGAGTLPAGMARELGLLQSPRLNWRSQLWRYLARAAVDFHSFDRRFVGRGLYLELLDGERLHVAVAVDTSGSIDSSALQSFLGELRGILRAYPHLQCDLFYADAALHGPFPLAASRPIPPPVGGGGTDFRPFFAELDRRRDRRPAVAVYLTDGYGPFPSGPPACPTLWVVTPGGRDLGAFPFGQTVRLLPSAPRANTH